MLDHGSSIMYFPLRHDANVNKESLLNSSASTLLDSSGSSARPFASSSFTSQSGTTPGFHHAGNLQGLHNQASYNMQTVPNALSSRNSGFGGPSSGAHLSGGNMPPGRFVNNLAIGLTQQQVSHGGLHGHSSMTNRAGISGVGSHAFSSSMNGVGLGGSPGSSSVADRGSLSGLGGSPSQMGGVGPRMASSVGGIGGGGGASLVGGGGLTRALNAGAGVNVQTLNGSRVNMGPLSSSSGIGVQGPGRPVNSILQQSINMSSSTYSPSGDLLAMISRASPQGISLLGNNFSTSPGSSVQGQGPSSNGQLGGMVLSNDGNGSDGVAFDINDFPQLTSRQSPSGGIQGPGAALRKQGFSVNSIVQQNQEFSIQNEDFPALPGFKGGSSELTSEMQQHQKDQQQEMAAMQSQHFSMGRSAGFPLGGSYAPHRHLQQQPAGMMASASMASGNASDLQHMHSSVGDSFPTSHGLSASYHSQAVGSPGAGGAQLHRPGVGATGSLGQYEQHMHYQQQPQLRVGGALHQQQQQQQQQMGMSGTPRESPKQGGLGQQQQPDSFGLLGLLSVIRMSDPDLTTLALGTDLTTLGLNLNSRENLYKTFASPWADGPTRGEPEFTLPVCYVQKPPRLQPGYFTKFQQDTLFYIFYSMPNDEAQLYAADELSNRGWFFHKDLKMWLTRVPNVESMVKTPTYERGAFFFFDPNTWETGRKDNFVLYYDLVETNPQLPSQH